MSARERNAASDEVEIAVAAGARDGASPIWDAGGDTLLWTDRAAHTVHRYTPGGPNHSMQVPQQVSAAIPRSRGGLLLHLREGVALFDAHGERRYWLVYWAREGFGGGGSAVDRAGRLWATTVHDDENGSGWLARISPEGAASAVVNDLPAGNGLAAHPDGNQVFLADSSAHRIDVLDVHHETGAVSGRRPWIDVGAEPAGLFVDAEDGVWVTLRDAGAVRHYTRDGALDRTIELPVQRPTGCCFGGPELTDLYVTSARDGLGQPSDDDGALVVLPSAGEGVRTPSFAG